MAKRKKRQPRRYIGSADLTTGKGILTLPDGTTCPIKFEEVEWEETDGDGRPVRRVIRYRDNRDD